MDKDYLIKKWLSDDLSEEEWEDFKRLEDFGLHMQLNESAKNFKAASFLSPDDFEVLKTKMDARSRNHKKTNWFGPILKIASVFLIAFGIYFAFLSENRTQVVALTGQKITAELPDASEVRLNAVSEISYNKEKWSEKREVTLEGEAFFKVAKGSIFDVLVAENGKVSVLGTQFNVKNREDFFEVICYEGSVSVNYKDTSKTLMPGNAFRVLNGEVFFDTILDKKPLWMQNISSFKQVPLKEVLLEIERQYSITIDATSVDKHRLFTGGFEHTNLDAALKAIAIPLNMTYQIQSSHKIVLKNSE